MKTQGRLALKLAFLFVLCLTVLAAIPQKLTDKNQLDTLAAKALETFLKISYKNNGRAISSSGVNAFLTKNKISVSQHFRKTSEQTTGPHNSSAILHMPRATTEKY